MRHVLLPAVCATLVLSLGACSSGKATEAECARFAAHFEELMAGGANSAEAGKTARLARDMARELENRCRAEGTASEVKCALAAASMEALQACSETK